MDDAAAEGEERFARVAVAPVLLDGIGYRLLGEAVLELEGRYRQTIDEKREVQRPHGLVAAVAQLPGDAETILSVEGRCLFVAGAWRAVKERDFVRAVLDAVAQHVNHAALADLIEQTRQELPPRGRVIRQIQRRRGLGLSGE